MHLSPIPSGSDGFFVGVAEVVRPAPFAAAGLGLLSADILTLPSDLPFDPGLLVFAPGFEVLVGVFNAAPVLCDLVDSVDLVFGRDFAALLVFGCLGACAPPAGFDICAAGFGVDDDFCEGAGRAFAAPPAAGSAFFVLSAGSDFCTADGFCTGADGFTAVFFWALDTGPSADIDLLTLSPYPLM